MDKATLRAQIKTAIAALKPAEIQSNSEKAVVRLLASPLYQSAQVIMAYDSGADEVSTRALLETILVHNKTLVLPRTNPKDRAIRALHVSNLQHDLQPSRFDFHEPIDELPEVALDRVDLLVVPGRAFDLSGNRLGRGVGYYDRFLVQPGVRAQTCALAFECQIVPLVPTDAHDRKVQCIFTEAREIRV